MNRKGIKRHRSKLGQVSALTKKLVLISRESLIKEKFIKNLYYSARHCGKVKVEPDDCYALRFLETEVGINFRISHSEGIEVKSPADVQMEAMEYRCTSHMYTLTNEAGHSFMRGGGY